MTEQTERPLRQKLKDFNPKQGDLVMLVYDKQVDCSNNKIVVGKFNRFAGQSLDDFSEFEGRDCYLILEPEEVELGNPGTIKLSRVSKYPPLFSLASSANRIYIGSENIAQALKEDPVAKKLIFYS